MACGQIAVGDDGAHGPPRANVDEYRHFGDDGLALQGVVVDDPHNALSVGRSFVHERRTSALRTEMSEKEEEGERSIRAHDNDWLGTF